MNVWYCETHDSVACAWLDSVEQQDCQLVKRRLAAPGDLLIRRDADGNWPANILNALSTSLAIGGDDLRFVLDDLATEMGGVDALIAAFRAERGL